MDWAWFPFVACLFAVIAGLYFYLHSPDPHKHAGYVVGKVEAVFVDPGTEEFSATAQITLPDGSAVSVGTRSGRFAAELQDEVCLDRRSYQSGAIKYQIAIWEKCTEAEPK